MMDDSIERMVISVRADTAAFSRDVQQMRSELDGPLAGVAARTGRTIEGALSRAVAGGKIGFDDLRRVATSALSDIAQSSLRSMVGLQLSPAESGLSGLGAVLSGLPGRATGGSVDSGRPYVVGERGPELFVPSAAGRIEQVGRSSAVTVNLNVSAPAGAEPQALQRSSRQIARALRSAIQRGR